MDAEHFDNPAGEGDRRRLGAFLTGRGLVSGPEAALEIRTLLDGRSGSRVVRVQDRGNGTCRIVKTIRRRRGLSEGMGNVDGGEGPLYLAGRDAVLPPSLDWPVLDAAFDRDRDEWWLVMRDVSAGIVPRDTWDAAHSRRLLAALARLHARHWGRDEALERLGLPTLRSTTRACAEFIRLIVSGDAPREPWLERLLSEVPFIAPLQIRFLELLPPADVDFFCRLVEGWERPVGLLEQEQPTLLHGDVQRTNVAFESDRVVLFDWEYAARGPAAVDLQNHWFFQAWAYPPGPVGDIPAWDDQRSDYLGHLEDALGRRVDRAGFDRACDLAWIREFIQLGFCLAEPLTDGNAEIRDRVATNCRRAVVRARRICERRLG